MTRYITAHIKDDLTKKMVWLGGPRQVGKTTLARSLAEENYVQHEYFNWDQGEDKKVILEKQWRSASNLIIFDELHKYPHWKQWLKGEYDTKLDHQQFLVTGSARMDIYIKGSESLLGRYHYWRLHPFTLDEWPEELDKKAAVDRLLTLGGFPEPFLQGDERDAKRWRNERFNNIIREDIQGLEQIQQLQLLDLFVIALRERVGGTLVISNLASDLKVAHKTCVRWLSIIERVYIAFSIYPLTANIPRSIQKPAKVYFYDNADVLNSDGARFENLVATHLLKRLQFIEDYEGSRTSLHYIRDKDGREVDFVTVIDGEVHELIEVKLSDDTISTALKYYHDKLSPKSTTQIVKSLKRSYDKDGIAVMTAEDYFSSPPWENITE